MPTGAKSGGAKKHGRNGVRCQQYKVEGRRERNKIRKLKRYIARNKAMVNLKTRKGHSVFVSIKKGVRRLREDKQAQAALKRLTTI